MTKKYYQNSLKFRVLSRIRRSRRLVVFREDLESMGSPRQISRCLKDLAEMGELLKIGYGVYAKTYVSKNLKKPALKGGFEQVCKEVLARKGVQWEVGSAVKAYNAGLTTQVPVRFIVTLKSRFRGQLSYGNQKLIIEGKVNAR
ncbi:MAG TPA: DUF6088 family protein [Gammaproteobacteria bacterium]|nr:DUF6088 family protein [Gammaproteobacteria bacterium]